MLDISVEVALVMSLATLKYGAQLLAEDIHLVEVSVSEEIGSGGSVISSGMALAGFNAVGPRGSRKNTKLKGVVPVDRWTFTLYTYVSCCKY